MFYYLYQITNLVNAKIYVGVHKTRDMNDGYMGSGKVILRAIEKHGTNNFKKVILETFADAKSMYAREKEVVNESFLSRKDVYNLRRGGHGGFDYINKIGCGHTFTNIDSRNGRRTVDSILMDSYGKNWRTIFARLGGEAARDRKIGIHAPANKLSGSIAARSIQARNKRILTFAENKHQQGEKNSQYGMMWITDGIHNQKTKKGDAIPSGWRRGRKN